MADAPLVVLDLNVVVSGMLAERQGASTPPAQCLAAARSGAIRLCLSPGMLTRLRHVLGYPKLGFDEGSADALSREIAEWVPREGWVPDDEAAAGSRKRRPLCPDVEDEAVLRPALAAGAAFLVTGDAHLLRQLTPEGARRCKKAGLAILTAGEIVLRR
jgi:predicted nucleic acid-binding protein